MSGGEQQMLAMGRALMARPTILLLDEPSMGLSPILTEQIFKIIAEINDQGTTVLLVEQNALMALDHASRGYVMETGRIVLSDKENFQGDMDRVFELFPRLHERRTQKAGTMSGGEQQMCAIGRALMARPKLLLLDEPSMGLAPILVETIFGVIREINKAGTTILLVEQNALMALSIASRGYVIQTGQIVLQDSADALAKNEVVRQAYLGET